VGTAAFPRRFLPTDRPTGRLVDEHGGEATRPCRLSRRQQRGGIARRRDHGLASIDGDDGTTRWNEPCQCRGVVSESTADLQDPAPGRGADNVITRALALGEKRQRVDQRQAAREHREVRRGVDALKSSGEVVGHVFPRSRSIRALVKLKPKSRILSADRPAI